ncbi:MAG: RlpA-like double-psi beta-barrel domain-containing protein [Candidatus Marinimicrobia bacterium]|nr:RlpA-like double-psi beta-barrel domain-containing protein [Candidatus Neomarinimicrobiota bacterium]
MKKLIKILFILCAFIFLFAQNESKVVIYEDGFKGALTASGEIFSQDKMTAAHETLPLGTQVEILNIQNGKKVSVTVNDRIKNSPDLFWISRAAANKLDIISVSPIEILYIIQGEVPGVEPSETYQSLFSSLGPNLELPEGDPRVPRSFGDEVQAYGVQIYACTKRMDAVTLSRRIQEELEYLSYFEKVKTDNGQRFRVIIGDFISKNEALDCYWKLQHDLPEIFLVEIY